VPTGPAAAAAFALEKMGIAVDPSRGNEERKGSRYGESGQKKMKRAFEQQREKQTPQER